MPQGEFVSNQQLELIDALKAQGHSNSEIAEWVGVDPHVVRRTDPMPEHKSTPIDSSGLDWAVIQDYLATGMSIAETATAAGISVEGLEAAYQMWANDNSNAYNCFDCVETWAGVLRARRHYELLKALETKALRGDLRSYIAVLKARYERHSNDAPGPTVGGSHGKEYEY